MTETTNTKQKKVEKKGMEVPMYDLTGKEIKKIGLKKDLFGIEYHPQLVSQYVRVYLQNQRQGTSSTKTRSEVVGSTRKIYRQKGTGGARHGSRKAPLFVGGGIAFGPKPRDYSLTMNKKQKRIALLSCLSKKAKDGMIAALSNDAMDMKPKTKEVAAFMKTIKADKQKVLVVLPLVKESGLVLSIRNIPNVELVQAANLNPYMLLNNGLTLFTEGALETLEKHFLKQHAD